MRPPISAADLLYAFKALDPQTDEEKREIAATLGFDLQPPLSAADRAVATTRRRARDADEDRAPPPPVWPAPPPRSENMKQRATTSGSASRSHLVLRRRYSTGSAQVRRCRTARSDAHLRQRRCFARNGRARFSGPRYRHEHRSGRLILSARSA